MIRVASKPEPSSFDRTVRKPGLRHLEELRGVTSVPKRRGRKVKHRTHIKAKDLKSTWTAALPDLRDAFAGVCGYCCIYIDAVTGAATVDHFVPKVAGTFELAFEWTNLRYACLDMNRRKGTRTDICDPLTVEPGWFSLNLVTFGLRAGPGLPAETNAKVEATIKALELDGAPMRQRREEAWARFDAERTPEAWRRLREDCPLVALEFERQRGLPPEIASAGSGPSTPRRARSRRPR